MYTRMNKYKWLEAKLTQYAEIYKNIYFIAKKLNLKIDLELIPDISISTENS